MSSFSCEVFLGAVPFERSSPHRYLNIDAKFNIIYAFTSCRMIKSNTVSLFLDDGGINQLSLDDLMRVNYGYYKYSSNLNAKKYYFFIDTVSYVNDNVANISFTIDWISTEIQNITFKKSFIDRIHSKNDTFTNTIENLGNNEPLKMWFNQTPFEFTYNNNYYIIATTSAVPISVKLTEEKWNDIEISTTPLYSQLLPPYSSLEQTEHSGQLDYTYYLVDGIEKVKNYVYNCLVRGYSSACAGIWKVPDFFINSNVPTQTINIKVSEKWLHTPINENITILDSTFGILPIPNAYYEIETPFEIDGYVPKYKKCLSFQFINPVVVFADKIIKFDYELFNNDESENSIISFLYDVKCPSTFYIVPENYNGSQGYDFTNCVSFPISESVMITTENTVYISGINQNYNNSLSTSLVNSAINDTISITKKMVNAEYIEVDDFIKAGGVFLGTGNPVASVGAVLADNTGDIASDIGNNVINQISPAIMNFINRSYEISNSSKGVTVTGTSALQSFSKLPSNAKKIRMGFSSYSNSDIKLVDMYFSMFGYKFSKIMEISINDFRDSYTFLKGDINFTGNISDTAKSEIKDAFKIGLTLWNNVDMFDYDVT